MTPFAVRASAVPVLAIVVGACGSVPGFQQGVVPADGSGGLAGFVRDEAGRPLSGAFVGASCQVKVVQIVTDANGWYDLGQAGLTPGRCSIKGGTDDGRSFFGEVMVVGGTSQRVDWTAQR